MIRAVAIALAALVIISCGKGMSTLYDKKTDTVSIQKSITSFIFTKSKNPALPTDITATINAATVNATVPYGTNTASLIPDVVISGVSINPADSAPQDFSGGPVTYTVTGADLTTKEYAVTVNIASTDSKNITSFKLLASENPISADVTGTISANAVTVIVPNGMDITNLIPDIAIDGLSVSPADGAGQNFSGGTVMYTVTASDGSTKVYAVTVNNALSGSKDILTFNFPASENSAYLSANITGRIGANAVTVMVPNGTDISNLTPDIAINGVSVSPGDGIARDFSGGSVTYTVTAADMTTKTYTVTIPPSQVTITGVTEDNAQVVLTWADPSDARFDHVEITWVPNGAAANIVNSGVQTYTATGLINPAIDITTVPHIYIVTEYTFSIISVDSAGNKSDAVTIKATPNPDGTVENYLIYTADDLNAVRGGSTDPKYSGWDKTKSYVLMSDIDLSGYTSWTPIGISSADCFSGHLNGNGHIISGLTINTTGNYQGLFGYIKGSSFIRNLSIADCNITGGIYIGGLAGQFDQDGSGKAMISNCHVSGTITTKSTGVIYEGGLVGWLSTTTAYTTPSSLINCSADITITTQSTTVGCAYLGGITGRQENSWQISGCYVTGSVNSTRGAALGGIVGSTNGYIFDSYSKADISAEKMAGGISGSSTSWVINSYSTGNVTRKTYGTLTPSTIFGGLLGTSPDASRYTTCYYSGTLLDADTGEEMDDNAFGTRKTGPQLRTQSTYTGWDFTAIWNIDSSINNGFPYLRSNMP